MLDVKNAFLHVTLIETVYCTQLTSFVDLAHLDMVLSSFGHGLQTQQVIVWSAIGILCLV
jgi:hypothetical protein